MTLAMIDCNSGNAGRLRYASRIPCTGLERFSKSKYAMSCGS